MLTKGPFRVAHIPTFILSDSDDDDDDDDRDWEEYERIQNIKSEPQSIPSFEAPQAAVHETTSHIPKQSPSTQTIPSSPFQFQQASPHPQSSPPPQASPLHQAQDIPSSSVTPPNQIMRKSRRVDVINKYHSNHI
ncbi:hypothetical protein OROMI_017443 [Orobanche minor]